MISECEEDTSTPTRKLKMFLVGNYCSERTRFRAERKCEPDLIFYVGNWPPGGAGAQD